MILDIFSELQRALPPGATADRAFEGQILRDAIEQAKLADAFGFGCWWTVEHHGATEFSYSSSPEMMLAVLAQHTERIHLGHSGVLGVRRVDGGSLAQLGEVALISPAGARGPVFAITRNFRVIRRYNNATSYALAVGHLGDRILGGPAFSATPATRVTGA